MGRVFATAGTRWGADGKVLVIACLVVAGAGGLSAQQPAEPWLGPAPRVEVPPPIESDQPPVQALDPVTTTSRAAVTDLYNTVYLPALAVPHGWTGNVAGCVAGAPTSAYRDAAMDAVNFFRAMAGLPAALTRQTVKDGKSQDAALMMKANNTLDHFPPNTWDCYTTDGAEAAGKANLAFGASGAAAVALYIRDPGAANEPVGHRRWILYPRQTEMGVGATDNTDALWVIGDFGTRAPSPEFVAWPAAGYMPFAIVYPRWSFSVNTNSPVDFSGATVTMTSDAMNVPLTMLTEAKGFGDDTIVWEPSGLTFTAGMNDRVITVDVQNVMVGGVPRSFSYDVIVFDPAVAGVQDTDMDGLPDEWEVLFGLDPNDATGVNGANGDPDGDLRTNLQEFQDGTHPRGFNTQFLAEGATGSFLATRVALLNPTGTAQVANLRFLRASSTPVSHPVALPPFARRTVDVQTVPGMADTAFATVIESEFIVVADRTMTWDPAGYGSHAETAVPSPATTWYFAEGATHSGFQLFYLLQNPNPTAATAQVEFLLPAPQPPVVKSYPLGPQARVNVWVNVEPELASAEMSAIVTSDQPIVAERAMYLNRPGGRLFEAGHNSAGIQTPALAWFLAEGATGPFFDLFVLIANPNDTDAQVLARFLRPDGIVVERNVVVPAKSRFTIWVDAEGPELADTAVSTTILSTNDVPVLVERAMWWPGGAGTWHEAHNSAGATATGIRWALAEGEVGGARNLETYVLIANTSNRAGEARVTLHFEDDGSTATQVRPLLASSRDNVDVRAEFPAAVGRRFGVVVESIGDDPVTIVVERAMYSDAGGQHWAAGTNALATRLP